MIQASSDSRTERRSVLLPWLAAALLLSLVAPSMNVRAEDRPNILLLLTDDQRADTIGAWGNTYIETPGIDELAARGFSFRRAYCMGSHHGAVCLPSRAMLLTGRSLFRVYDKLDDVVTLPEVLRDAGYETFFTGKWHQNRKSLARCFSRARTVMFGGMSDHEKVPLCDMLDDRSFTPTRHDGFSSTLFADQAIRFLEELHAKREEGDTSRPFFGYVAFTAPHDPRTPPAGKYRDMYRPEEIPLPPDYMPVHPFHNGWMTGRDEQLAAWPRTTEVIRSQLAEYYGLITHLDHQIGRITDALRRLELERDTIIVFASDHGLSVGSHGLLGKQNLYEHSMRTPLILVGPGIPSSASSDDFVYLHDVMPTLCGLAGVAGLPDGVEGRDLSPSWKGRQRSNLARTTIFTAYEDRMRAVRDDRWKLIRYPRIHYTQLFDLQKDPYELVNLADRPAHGPRIGAMMKQLEAWQRDTDDPHPLTAETRESMVFEHENVKRKADRWQPAWVREKYFDD